MNETEIELKANSTRTDSYDGNARKQFCEQVGIDLDYLSTCICGDFQIEDMIRAYDKGSMKLEAMSKRIKELEEENAEYESEAREINFRLDKYIKRTVPKLVKAREIIQKLLEEKENMYRIMNSSDKSSYFKIKKEAEEFIEHVFENED